MWQMRGGDGTNAGDSDYEATVFFDADYGAFRTFKVAGDDADTLAFTEFGKVVREIFYPGDCCGGDDAKHFHLFLGNYGRVLACCSGCGIYHGFVSENVRKAAGCGMGCVEKDE